MNDFAGDRKRMIVGVVAILVVAGVLVAAPRGSDVTQVISAALQAGFLAAGAAAGWRTYRAQSGRLAELPDRDRAVLFGALALATLTIVGRARFDEIAGSAGLLLWLCTLGGCGAALYWVWRESRRYTY
ncbi:MAG: hypothetical protein HY827_07585 [Actinobacteria bacterium]|nr:hypothetical protein [Actinomycetota bacterium]